MGGRGGGSRASALGQAQAKTATASEGTAEEQTIRELYHQLNLTLTSKGGEQFKVDIVSLDRLRDRLNDLGWSREKQDTELLKLMRSGKAVLIPESNQKTLTPKQRAAAIHVGGQDKHLISLDK